MYNTTSLSWVLRLIIYISRNLKTKLKVPKFKLLSVWCSLSIRMKNYGGGTGKNDQIKHERELEHWFISGNCTKELFEINLARCKDKGTSKHHGLYLLTWCWTETKGLKNTNKCLTERRRIWTERIYLNGKQKTTVRSKLSGRQELPHMWMSLH